MLDNYALSEAEFKAYWDCLSPRLPQWTDLLCHIADVFSLLTFAFIIVFQANVHNEVHVGENQLLYSLRVHLYSCLRVKVFESHH